MARPLRIEFPGAIYHVTSRGDRREPIFEDDVDRETLLSVVAHAMSRFDAQVLAYCLMGNHFHFVIHTRQANLSLLMRHINNAVGVSLAFCLLFQDAVHSRRESCDSLFKRRNCRWAKCKT